MSKKCITTRGVVTSGRGNACRHISEHAEEIELLTRHVPFPGSLNVILDKPLFLSNTKALRFDEGQRLLWPGKLNRIPVWLYRWQQTPLHVLEVLSETKLRDHLNLKDGDRVEVEVDNIYVARMSWKRHLAWRALWAGRARWPYTHDRYYWRTRPLSIELGATQDNGDGHVFSALAKHIYREAKHLPVIGPVLARARKFLNDTKTRGSGYSAQQSPTRYHLLEIFGRHHRGPPKPRLLIRNLPIDCRGKRVLVIANTPGELLLEISDQIALGTGLYYDYGMANAAERLAVGAGVRNLHFLVCDLETDPLNLIFDLIPGGRIDIVFLLSVGAWIDDWRSVFPFCAENAESMVFESDGSDEQQAAHEAALRGLFANVRQIQECSNDDPIQKRRKLFLCEQALRGRKGPALASESSPTSS